MEYQHIFLDVFKFRFYSILLLYWVLMNLNGGSIPFFLL